MDASTKPDRSLRTPDLLVVIGAAVLAAVLMLTASRTLPVMTPDSTYYLTGAQSFADGHTPLDFNDWPITAFPPGYAAVVAIGVVAGASPLDSARAVNAASAALIVLLTFVIARRHMDSRLGPILVACVVALSPGWVEVTVMIQSEALFGVLVLAFLWLLDRMVIRAPDDGVKAGFVIALALLAGFTTAVRLLGFALIAAGAVMLLLVLWRASWRRALLLTCLFGGTALLLPLAVALRNIQVGSGPFGDRAANAVTTFGEVLSELFTALRTWFGLPELATGGVMVAIGSLITIAFVAIVIAALVRTRNRPTGSRHALPIGPTLTVMLALAIALVGSAAMTPLDPINLRLVSSFLAPAMILVGWSAEGVVSLAPPRWRVPTVASAAVVVWLVLAAVSAITFAARPDDHGLTVLVAGDPTTAFTESVQSLPENAIVYSNNPWRLWMASDRGSRLAPLVRGFRSSTETNDLPELVAAVTRAESCGKPVYLAWYVKPSVMDFHSLDVLSEHLELTRVGPDRGADSEDQSDSVFEITTKGIDLPPC